MSALEEVLAGGFDVDPDEQESLDGTDRFVVDTIEKAEWALRKLAQYRNRQAENRALAEAEIARIETWLVEENARYLKGIEFFEALLVEFHRRELRDDPKRKTISLPAGNLKARKLPDSIEIVDEESFKDFAETERNDLLRIQIAPDKNALKQAVLRDGEVIPGVAAVTGDLRFSIDINRKDDAE